MPFNRQCRDVYSQFRSGSTNVIFIHNLKNSGEVINIFSNLLFTITRGKQSGFNVFKNAIRGKSYFCK